MMTLQERVHKAKPKEPWPLNKLHHVLVVRGNNKNIGMINDNLLSLSYGRIVNKNIDTTEGLLPESFETYQIVQPGDIVMRLTDLQNDKRSIRQGLVKEQGIITSAYDAVYPKRGHDSSFWAYALFALDFAKYYYSLGGGVRQSIKFKDFPNDWIFTPPTETQKEIAGFLDQETGRIDQLIEKKKRLLEVLINKKASEINYSVTRGIDNAPTVSTGIKWVENIPAHWEMVPATALFENSNQRAQPNDQMLSATQKYGVISKAKFERLEGRSVTHAFVHLEKRKHVEINDFVISMRSFEGGIERAREVGCVRSSYIVLKSKSDVNPLFFGFLFKSTSYIQGLRATSNFIRDGQDLSFSNFRQVQLPKLSLEEQAKIAAYLEIKVQSIDKISEKIALSISKLHEFRISLITAAVTGQLDISTWKKNGGTDKRLDNIEKALAS